jgi:hypothetical protein
MSAMTKRMIAVVGVAVLASAGAPAMASAEGARLYEMTENMKLTAKGKFERRQATSELIGTADVGTPLCPHALVDIYAPGAKSCTINSTGSDNISLATGLGQFNGTFTTVVQGDNNADSPEFVIMKGSFKGKMDFSPAILMMIPLGSVTGKLTVDGAKGSVPFHGTFRLPFVISGVKADGTICTPDPAVPGCFPVNDAALFGNRPLPLTPMERYDLTKATRPLYLLDNFGLLPIRSSEFGAGWAAVKFEISF